MTTMPHIYEAIDHDIAARHAPMACHTCDPSVHADGGEGAGCWCPMCICPHVEGGMYDSAGVCCGCDGGDECRDGYYRTNEEMLAANYPELVEEEF